MKLMEFFATATDDGYGGIVYMPTTAGYVTLAVLLIVLLVGIFFINRKRVALKVNTKQLVFSALAIALAIVTSNIKLFKMPMGGSVTLLSMFFICLIGYWYGVRIGLLTGVAYGLLQLIIDPYIISIPQMLIDYFLAFGALGLSGIFAKKESGLIPGYVVGILGRYFFSILSGVIFFGSYAPETMSPLVYSISYNGLYIGAEGAITVVLLLVPQVAQAMRYTKRMAIS